MKESEIDQVATVKASLEMMILENNETHEYFSDLVEKLAELDVMDPVQRRKKFNTLVEMGAFKFNGVDIRHFARSQAQGPLPPPLFLTRTRRRLKNTMLMIEEFKKRELFGQAENLLEEIDRLSSTIVNENDHMEVASFKEKIEGLRNTEIFKSYMNTRNNYIHKDTELQTDTEIIAAKEKVEEGEEFLEQRGEHLSALGEQLENGEVSPDEAGNLLEGMAFDKT